MNLQRPIHLANIAERFQHQRVLALLGPRQCGKTTLAKQFAAQSDFSATHFFDCEDPRDTARLANPMLTLAPLEGLVILDEIQLMPELFAVLRVLVDRHDDTRFLILGSASPSLLKGSAETLAGRIGFIELSGFNLNEVDAADFDTLWLQGSFPRAFLGSAGVAAEWRRDYIRTYLERDIPALGLQIPARTLRRFWTMLAHYHGQIFNASEIGKSIGLSDKTVKNYLDILSGTYLIRQLQPWFYNTTKRLVKRPKIYFRDSGLFHSFQNIETLRDLQHHPKLGASWEGFMLEQVIGQLRLQEDEVFFWNVHGGAELDMLFQRHGKRWGVEVKFQEAPKLTRSMSSALQELELAHLWVVYPGTEIYPVAEQITAVGAARLQEALTIS